MGVTTRVEDLVYGLVVVSGFFALGLILLTQAQGIQRRAIRQNRWRARVPVMGQLLSEWVETRSYVVFLRLIGAAVILTSALLTYSLFRQNS